MTENEIGKIIVDCAIKLHMDLGPGLLESVYERILAKQLEKRGLKVETQVPVSFEYDGITFDEGFRVDMIVENKVIVELKSVEVISNAHNKQLLTYLKLSYKKLGYLINFGADLLKKGLHRIINGVIE